MRKTQKIGWALFAFVCLVFFLAQSSVPVKQSPLNQQTLNQLQERAMSQLAELTSSVERLKEYNSNLEQNLSESETQRTILEQQFTNSLTLANDYFTSMTVLKTKLEHSQKVNRNLWIALIIWTALKVVRIILGFIPQTRIINKIIPWWLDVLI